MTLPLRFSLPLPKQYVVPVIWFAKVEVVWLGVKSEGMS